MTIEEAITYFKHILSGQYGKNTTRGFALQRAAFERAIEALEKQIPKKPIMLEQIYVCPTCGDSFNMNEYEMDYCWECGQGLDWSDAE